MQQENSTGRSVLITGSSRGIGAEIARMFARTGAQVCLTGRNTAALSAVASEIRSAGGVVALVASHDLSNRAGVDALIEDVRRATGSIDVLINNAGVGSRGDMRPVVDFDPDFWSTTLSLNLTAPFLLCRALVPSMIERGFGRVINIASINGRVPSLNSSAYVASKHGLLGFTRVLALEVAKSGVTVNAICPGPVDVDDDRRIEFDAKRANMSIREFEQQLTPIGGRLQPKEIAPLAVFLSSDVAASITGQAINVDRGMVMS